MKNFSCPLFADYNAFKMLERDGFLSIFHKKRTNQQRSKQTAANHVSGCRDSPCPLQGDCVFQSRDAASAVLPSRHLFISSLILEPYAHCNCRDDSQQPHKRGLSSGSYASEKNYDEHHGHVS